MKHLFLIRHAKASWKNPTLTDFDRPLNKRGKQNAPVMGKRLAEQKITPGTIISSPARRAIETAKIIANKIDFPKKRIIQNEQLYLADVESLLDVIHFIDEKHKIAFLVGHNPGMTMLANYLANADIDNIPTCGIFCIDFAIKFWKEVKEDQGKFIFFDYPKKHL